LIEVDAMNKEARRSSCPDCGGSLDPINLVDHDDEGMLRTAEYGVRVPKQHWWSRSLKIVGTVEARMCSECGRILLYGEPKPQT
jgi:hypothetical protein